MLRSVASKVAEQFRTDPKVAEMIQPAVWIDADEEGCVAAILERLEAIEALSPFQPVGGQPLAIPKEEAPITIVVVDHRRDREGARTFNVPDPRQHPDHWPWTGDDDLE
jgi:hypothetical protein